MDAIGYVSALAVILSSSSTILLCSRKKARPATRPPRINIHHKRFYAVYSIRVVDDLKDGRTTHAVDILHGF